jgi:hypothetical protein
MPNMIRGTKKNGKKKSPRRLQFAALAPAPLGYNGPNTAKRIGISLTKLNEISRENKKTGDPPLLVPIRIGRRKIFLEEDIQAFVHRLRGSSIS